MDADEAKTIENQGAVFQSERESRWNQNCETPSPAHYTVYKLMDPMGKVYIGCLGRRNTCGGYHWRFADEEKEKTAADLEESAAVRFRDKD